MHGSGPASRLPRPSSHLPSSAAFVVADDLLDVGGALLDRFVEPASVVGHEQSVVEELPGAGMDGVTLAVLQDPGTALTIGDVRAALVHHERGEDEHAAPPDRHGHTLLRTVVAGPER